MAYYIVVRNPEGPQAQWSNQWDPSRPGALLSFTTARRIAEQAQSHGRLLVHRCGHGSHPPAIVCEAEVTRVSSIDRRTSWVELRPLRVMNEVPPMNPMPGQSDYEAGH